ncbi:MAG: hypothetical protein JNM56_27530 [Planctomycetia bacterium]|nr:hypothetical protein [Planctomycetia bacterium]
MIELPQRSVTRFFIPLIDVLLLLFCIYLLMPIAEGVEHEGVGGNPAELKEKSQLARQELNLTRREVQQERHKLSLARKELLELQKEKNQQLNQRLAIRVLEIDPKNGQLWTTIDRGERLAIDSADDAHRLIQRHKQEVGGRELYYLFLFPRQDTGFPEQGQFEQYERWFSGVSHGLDNPRGMER